jgi:hypothetical protein
MAGKSYQPDDSIAAIYVKPNGQLVSRRVRFEDISKLRAPWDLVRLVSLHDTNLAQSPETVQWNDPDTLPEGPESDVRYLVGDAPLNEWASHAGEFATWDGASWTFAAPQLNSDRAIVSSDPAPPAGESWNGQEGKVATYVGSGSGWAFSSPDPPGEVEYSSQEELDLDRFETPNTGVEIRKVNQSGSTTVVVEDYYVSRGGSGSGRTLPRRPTNSVRFFYLDAGSDSQQSPYPAKLIEADAINAKDLPIG